MRSTDRETWRRITTPDGRPVWIGYGNEKNRTLMRERAVSFDQIILEVVSVGLVNLYRDERDDHRHRNQWMLHVAIRGYTYTCPCKMTEGPHHETALFLKTCYPDRKAARRRRS